MTDSRDDKEEQELVSSLSVVREEYINSVLADGKAIEEAVEVSAALQFMALACGLTLSDYLAETAEYMALKYSQEPMEG